MANEEEQLNEELRQWWSTCDAAVQTLQESDKEPEMQLPEDVAKLYEEAVQIVQDNNLTRGEALWLPEEDLASTATAPKDWDEYAELRGMPIDSDAKTALITNVLTFPLTAFHVLKTAADPALLTKSDLEVHLLGAEYDTEADGPEKWAELLQLLPNVQRLSLVLIGPELPEEMNGQAIVVSVDPDEGQTEERTASIQFYSSLYHDMPESLPTPDLAIAFNSGLLQLSQAGSRVRYEDARGHIWCRDPQWAGLEPV